MGIVSSFRRRTFTRFAAAGLLLLVLILPGLIRAADPPVEPLGLALEGYPYPHTVEYLKLEIQRQPVEMAYMDVRPQNANGRTMMLLHGKNFNGAYWATTIDALTREGFRVIVPDQIGFGKSSKPPDVQYSFQMLAQNTKALLDHLKVSKTAVLGHSMGGMLAVRFALMYPEVTEKLVLVNPIGLEDWKVKVPYQPVEHWYVSELRKTEEGLRSYQQQNYYHGTWKPEYEPWVQLLYRWTLSPEYRRLAWVNALTYDMIFTQPVVYEFSNIKAPALLIIGQLDRTALGKDLVAQEVAATMGQYPRLGKKTQQAIPNSELAPLEGVGHLPHIEAFDRFWQALLPFLKR